MSFQWRMGVTTFENPFDEKCQKALRYIREAGGTYTHSTLLKRMQERDILKVAADDELGRKLQDIGLSVRRRASKRS